VPQNKLYAQLCVCTFTMYNEQMHHIHDASVGYTL